MGTFKDNFNKYKGDLLQNKEVCKIIADGDLSIQNCIDNLEGIGYRIVKIDYKITVSPPKRTSI